MIPSELSNIKTGDNVQFTSLRFEINVRKRGIYLLETTYGNCASLIFALIPSQAP